MDDTASRNEESHYQDSQSSQLQPSRRSYPPNDNQIFQHRSSQPSIPGAYYQSADSHSRGIESALPRNCSSSYQYDSRDVRFHRGPYPDLRPDFDAHREPHPNFRPDFEATPRCSRHSARPSSFSGEADLHYNRPRRREPIIDWSSDLLPQSRHFHGVRDCYEPADESHPRGIESSLQRNLSSSYSDDRHVDRSHWGSYPNDHATPRHSAPPSSNLRDAELAHERDLHERLRRASTWASMPLSSPHRDDATSRDPEAELTSRRSNYHERQGGAPSSPSNADTPELLRIYRRVQRELVRRFAANGRPTDSLDVPLVPRPNKVGGEGKSPRSFEVPRDIFHLVVALGLTPISIFEPSPGKPKSRAIWSL